MAEPQELDVSVADGIATLVINRPEKLNALNRPTLEAMERATSQLREDDGVRGIIVTGRGEKAFVAGADIEELTGLGPREAAATSRLGQRIFRGLELSPKPVVAAVNGFALGGGCELALACHLRIASTSARFGLPEVKLGLMPGYGGTVRLPRIVGKGRALAMILTGEMIDAEEAHRIGLVNRVSAPDDLLDDARAMLSTMIMNAPLALEAAVESVTRGLEMSMDDALALESKLFGLLADTDDMREGTSAFLEKRKASFVGR